MSERAPKRASRSFAKRFKTFFSRAEKRILIAWIRFARAHRDSHRLFFFMFLILYADGFLMVIPSMLVLVVGVSITPKRWMWCAIIFGVAATLNNMTTYFIGRSISPNTMISIIETFHLSSLWASAQEAFRNYGPLATLIGAIIGLPTQMMTALIGMADAKLLIDNPTLSSSFFQALLYAFVGHFSKAFAAAAVVRYGWVKLEKKFG